MYNVTLNRVHAPTVACGKAISITYCVCVFVTLDIQHTKSVHNVVLCSMSGSNTFFFFFFKNYMIFIKM
jgi:hypothetical protein